MTTWVVDTIVTLGYPGIILFMVLESSFVPFPSEIVMIPAGYLAAQGKMDPYLAVLCAIVGSLIGAYINYAIAYYLGRPFLERWGKFLGLKPERLHRMEAFFERHGEVGTFTGRLITVVRQYISFPAGLAGMDLKKFSIYTGAGAGLWCALLCALGYWFGTLAGKDGTPLDALNQIEEKFKTHIAVGTILFAVIVVALYALWFRKKKKAQLGTGN
ncbi:MAG: DedA family protein [Planctomycetes bacterium]|nr:DedA family protein [Planctomycetota bacterium]